MGLHMGLSFHFRAEATAEGGSLSGPLFSAAQSYSSCNLNISRFFWFRDMRTHRHETVGYTICAAPTNYLEVQF